jgi:hypothetical protein
VHVASAIRPPDTEENAMKLKTRIKSGVVVEKLGPDRIAR